MPSTAQDITHYAGDSATITIGPIRDQDGALVDLGGALGARWWIGKNASATGTDVWVKKNSDETLVDETSATVDQIEIIRIETDGWGLLIRLIPSDTETVSTTFKPQPGSWYHEAEIVDADSKVSTVTIGKFTLKPTIVRNA